MVGQGELDQLNGLIAAFEDGAKRIDQPSRKTMAAI